MIKVEPIDKFTWERDFSENAHKAVFAKIKPAYMDRIDYALLLVDEKFNTILGYIACRELDHETVYWQFGGGPTDLRGKGKGTECLEAVLEWAIPKYKRVTFFVENENYPMLGLAMKFGFKIIGIKNHKSSVLLEHVKEL
jgi:RimJ/RimL family protein N-acetyltransferase